MRAEVPGLVPPQRRRSQARNQPVKRPSHRRQCTPAVTLPGQAKIGPRCEPLDGCRRPGFTPRQPKNLRQMGERQLAGSSGTISVCASVWLLPASFWSSAETSFAFEWRITRLANVMASSGWMRVSRTTSEPAQTSPAESTLNIEASTPAMHDPLHCPSVESDFGP